MVEPPTHEAPCGVARRPGAAESHGHPEQREGPGSLPASARKVSLQPELEVKLQEPSPRASPNWPDPSGAYARCGRPEWSGRQESSGSLPGRYAACPWGELGIIRETRDACTLFLPRYV